MPKFVFLWTDLVLWLVVLGAVVYAVRVRKNRHLLTTWRHVARNASAMSAAVVLGVFIVIALLDSVHFRPRLPAAQGAAADATVAYATRTLSVLDTLLAHAIDAREKTYSVPLAYWSFQREAQVVDGVEVRSFPRLAFGGAHLADPERDWVPDLVRRSATGLIGGLL
ncbi:MAG: ABC transporter permease, partial [Burkholderiaceae bacterium]